MTTEPVKLGQRVRDPITRMEGIVVARTEFLYGCVRIAVQPETTKDGASATSEWIDEPQLKVVAAETEFTGMAPVTAPAGARPDARRAADPPRR